MEEVAFRGDRDLFDLGTLDKSEQWPGSTGRQLLSRRSGVDVDDWADEISRMSLFSPEKTDGRI